MTEAANGQVECPSCGKRYQWKAALAGRKVACKCGQKMQLPSKPGGEVKRIGPPPKPVDDNTYDLDIDEEKEAAPAPAPARPPKADDGPTDGALAAAASMAADKCPSCNQPLKPGAVLCVNCGFNLQSGQRIETTVAADPAPAGAGGGAPAANPDGPDSAVAAKRIAREQQTREEVARDSQFTNIYLPLAMIAIGLAIRLLDALFFTEDATVGLAGAVIVTAIDVVISLPLLLLGLIVAVQVLSVSFGPLGMAMFKLLAILLAPAAIGDISQALLDGFLGWIAGVILPLILMWALVAKLFSLEANDAINVVIIMIVVRFLALIIMGVFVLGYLFA